MTTQALSSPCAELWDMLTDPTPHLVHTGTPLVGVLHAACTPEAPKPTATKQKPPFRGARSVESWRPLVTTYFPVAQVDRALCVMAGESAGDPTAKNSRSTAAGLFQFLQSTWDNMVPASVTGGSYASGQVYDPEANIRAAAWLQATLGWSQWSWYNRGHCR